MHIYLVRHGQGHVNLADLTASSGYENLFMLHILIPLFFGQIKVLNRP